MKFTISLPKLTKGVFYNPDIQCYCTVGQMLKQIGIEDSHLAWSSSRYGQNMTETDRELIDSIFKNTCLVQLTTINDFYCNRQAPLPNYLTVVRKVIEEGGHEVEFEE